MENKETKFKAIRVILFFTFIAFIIFITVRYTPEFMRLISNMDKFRTFITGYGITGILVYTALQAAHVVIVIIPGEVIQIAGGYIYGTVFGTIYTMVGLILGVVIVFFSTRLFGYSVVKIFIPKDKLQKFDYLINSPKAEIIMFVLFLIPGIPKDALTYMGGLTPVKPLRFIIMCTVARFPGILGSCYIGANIQSHNYTVVIVVSSIAVVLFVLGVIFQNRLVNFIHKIRSKT